MVLEKLWSNNCIKLININILMNNVKIKPNVTIKPNVKRIVTVKEKEKRVLIPYYISIDVAIKTLAYCIMTEDGEPIEWNIINMANGDTKLLCSSKLKSKDKSCSNKAYYQNVDNNKIGLCSTHYKGILDKGQYRRNITVANTPEFELISTLYSHLSKIQLTNIKCVLIERQPTRAREKMKHVAYALFSYFIFKEMDKVYFVDAKNKLTLYDGPPLSCHLKGQYDRNKWYGVQYCMYILKQRGYRKAQMIIDKQKKQDDLADCFLQGLWYILYGKDGTKAPITSQHQKLVYKESNMLKYKKYNARKPSAKILKTGKYTLANIKYLIMKQNIPENEPDLRSSICFYFNDLEYFSKHNTITTVKTKTKARKVLVAKTKKK
uniref:Uncharacterized protein n=1 Tax=viral metagenome TaxID=1070528 RepID=A0A6C0J8K7_9ZZZZ